MPEVEAAMPALLESLGYVGVSWQLRACLVRVLIFLGAPELEELHGDDACQEEAKANQEGV